MGDLLVRLFCYDLSNGIAANLSLPLLGRHVEGIWHTAIVVYGKEFFFDGGVGIVDGTPRKTRFGEPIRVEVLGITQKTKEEFLAWVRQQRRNGFGPEDYSLLNRNCNHFTQEAARFLVDRDIPDDIRNMISFVLETPLGAMLRPMLEGITTAPASGSSAPPPRNPESSHTVEVTNTGLCSAKQKLTTGEEEDLMLALAMLQSNELLMSGSREGFDTTHGALTLLRSVMMNILQHPTESKYRSLSTSSETYTKKLLPLEEFGVVDILRLSGFRLCRHQSGNGQRWYLSDADGSKSILEIMISHVEKIIDAVNTEASKQVSCATTNNPGGEVSCGKEGSLTETNHKKLYPGEHILEKILHDAGKPLGSLKELLDWLPSKGGSITPAVPCRSRVGYTSGQRPRLLVCHDMCGGYKPGDYPYFGLCNNSSSHSSHSCHSVKPVVDTSYTVNYWHLVDYFVYFAHHRVSIPPKEWINAGHREGVPVLGTFISEHNGLDIRFMLHSAKETSATIERLVDLCNAYNFDGYLINIESQVDEILAKRLVAFVALLRKTLNKRRPQSNIERVVIWYDAVIITGDVYYQNALTVKNKPFFDVANGIFTNYSWRNTQLKLSESLAGDRARDVYVGVDVFGRGGMYGGGGFNSDVAAKSISDAKLSTALFAPGWTLEVKGNKKRETFLRSDAKMWSKLQNFFGAKHVNYNTLPVWTCFRSAVGKKFYVNGNCVVGEGPHTAEWCQLSQAHPELCCEFLSDSSVNNDALYALPLEEEHNGVCKQQKNFLHVEWRSNMAWMGDRSLSFLLPCGATVTLLQWRVNISSGGDHCNSGALAFLDIVWQLYPSETGDRPSRCVSIEGVSGSSITRLVFDEDGSSGAATKVVARFSEWEIVRYIISAQTNWSHVTSVFVSNVSKRHPMRCTIGGIGFSSPFHHRHGNKNDSVSDDDDVGDDRSLLLVGSAQELPAEAVSIFLTEDPTKRVAELKMPYKQRQRQPWEVLVFANVNIGECAPACVYMGQHEVKDTLLLALHIVPDAVVEKVFFYDVVSGS